MTDERQQEQVDAVRAAVRLGVDEQRAKLEDAFPVLRTIAEYGAEELARTVAEHWANYPDGPEPPLGRGYDDRLDMWTDAYDATLLAICESRMWETKPTNVNR